MENKIKDLIKAVFTKHGIDPKQVFDGVELAEAKLEDGTIIVTEGEFAVGAPVMIQTEEGVMPLPEGAHVLEDGTPFEVDAESNVLVWGTPEEEEMSTPLTEEKVEDMIKSAVSTMLEEFTKIQSESTKEAEEKVEALTKELNEHLSKADAEKSNKPQKVVVQKSPEKMSKKERMMHAFNSRKK